MKGGLNLTTRKGALAGGDTGPVFNATKPESSRLLRAIEYTDDGLKMPPKSKLAEKDAAILARWVKGGLAYPTDQLGDGIAAKRPLKRVVVTEEAKKYWAYQPVKRPDVPVFRESVLSDWIKTPVDAFVLAKLKTRGLKPGPPADKGALVRRAYYDLLGLPPTPKQIDAFVKDASPKAWENLIDELLASSHYGEKWGRHWLDVVRFAESDGYEEDSTKPHAWRYRDYVIQSFNADKPYDLFVKEQLAGDELPGSSTDAIVATGFYRLGVYDRGPADRDQALFDAYDDLLSVTGQVFLGTTFNCARCHDHKADPIPQADYYRLLAFIRGVPTGPGAVDITSPEKKKLNELESAKRKETLAEISAKIKGLEGAAIEKMPPEDRLASEGAGRSKVLSKVPQFLERKEREEYFKLREIHKNLRQKLIPAPDLAMGLSGGSLKPPPVFVLARGNPRARGREVKPGFPEVFGLPDPPIPTPNPQLAGRRTQLANWIASNENPLTARVFINRVWQHHFGRGIVPTANDFGKLGEKPSNPELLDWLAAEFVEGGWTLKRVHKLLMMSSVYQLTSSGEAVNLKADPSNVLLWRYNLRRLNAEEVRDSLLDVSGKLKLDLYGKSVFPKIPREVLAGLSRPGAGWNYDSKDPDAGNRRSVYVFVKRAMQVPILIAHDQADTDSSCPVRYTTTVPTQALGLLNGEFSNEMALAFAKRLRSEAPGDLAAQVTRGIRLTTSRVPDPEEVNRDMAFVKMMKSKHALDDLVVLSRYALLLLNANEFVYVD